MKSKINLCSGIFNVALGSLLAIDCVVLGIVAILCLLLSFSLFFLAAIPLFLIFGFLFILAAVAAVANIVTGAGAIVSSVKGGKISRVFSAVSIIVDGIVMPSQALVFAYSVYGFATEHAPVFIVMAAISLIAVGLCIAGVVLNIVRIVKYKADA